MGQCLAGFCNFRPRYNYTRSNGKWPKDMQSGGLTAKNVAEIMRETQELKKTYVHDICESCGTVKVMQ